jgi:hypothetical protein
MLEHAAALTHVRDLQLQLEADPPAWKLALFPHFQLELEIPNVRERRRVFEHLGAVLVGLGLGDHEESTRVETRAVPPPRKPANSTSPRGARPEAPAGRRRKRESCLTTRPARC